MEARSGVDEGACNLGVAALGRYVQWREAPLVLLRVDLGAMGNEHLDAAQLAAAGGHVQAGGVEDAAYTSEVVRDAKRAQGGANGARRDRTGPCTACPGWMLVVRRAAGFEEESHHARVRADEDCGEQGIDSNQSSAFEAQDGQVKQG